MGSLDGQFESGKYFASESEVKKLTTEELKLVLGMGMVTLKSFSELKDQDLTFVQKVLPEIKDIINATIHNVKLISKEITLRSLPMN